MGHLKRIGKKECCADCTPNKCDDCGDCHVFAVRSFCLDELPPLCLSGWAAFAGEGTNTPEDCDPCARWRVKKLSGNLDMCSAAGNSQRDIYSGDVILPKGQSREPLSDFFCSGTYDEQGHRDRFRSESDDDCFVSETLDTFAECQTGAAADDDTEDWIFLCDSVQKPPPTAASRTYAGTRVEELSGEETFTGEFMAALGDDIDECARENCVRDTVENKAARLALTEYDAGDVVIQQKDDEGNEFCGDGMHFEFLGGDESEPENWVSRGLVFRCPYESPDTPEGCVRDLGVAISWLWLDDGLTCGGATTNICLSGDGQIRVADFAVALKNLEPDADYVLKVKFRRCEIDDENTPFCPSATTYSPGCVGEAQDEEDREWEDVTREVAFTAESWAEIIALDCSQIEVEVRKCLLEKEAAILNDEDSGNRTVSCSPPSERLVLEMPLVDGYYYQLIGCELAEEEP